MLVHKTITEFIEELASDSPAPGGGSTAALVGALGAALCAMVANLTKGDKFAMVKPEVDQCGAQAAALKDRLVRYVDEDTAAFNQVMAAYRLPKDSPEDKAQRTQMIQNAMQAAACLPLEVAFACRDVLQLSIRVIQVGNPNAASDAAVAGVTAYAAIYGALYNVKINLLSIKDSQFVEEMKEKINVLTTEAETLYRKSQQLAQEKIM